MFIVSVIVWSVSLSHPTVLHQMFNLAAKRRTLKFIIKTITDSDSEKGLKIGQYLMKF